VFGFAFNVFAFNYTFGPAASRRKGGQRRGTIWVIYVAAGWFGSSANPFFSSLYLISLGSLAPPPGGQCRRSLKRRAVETHV
jgi:hypothetical protein